MSIRTSIGICLVSTTLCLLGKMSLTPREVTPNISARVNFVTGIYQEKYKKPMRYSRALEIVGWCYESESAYGVDADLLLALLARERAFLNAPPSRRRDGSGYSQMTAGRARLLDKRFKGMTDKGIEHWLVVNPRENILLAGKWLSELLKKGDTREAICRYNVGPNGNVDGEAARGHWAAVERYYNALKRSEIN